MKRLVTSEQMRCADQHAIEQLGIPGSVLMENAARSVADWIEQTYLQKAPHLRVMVCCGKGNNGGDGFAIARLLANRGYSISVIEAGPAKTEDALLNQKLWRHWGRSACWGTEAAGDWLEQADLVVDAIFGTGLERAIEGSYEAWVHSINQNTDAVKIAVDIPSGIHADHGSIMGAAVNCDATVSFQFAKQGLYQYPGRAYAGEVITADISIPSNLTSSEQTYLMTEGGVAALLPARTADAHKRDFGHVLSVTGSVGMAGAALMTAGAALRSGSGLMTACVPSVLQPLLAMNTPEVMTLSPKGETYFFTAEHVEFVRDAAGSRDVVVMGCGLGADISTRDFVRGLISELKVPLLIDADGLNHLMPEYLKAYQGELVITPHPKELSRLSGLSVDEIQSKRIETVRCLSQEWGVTLLLKGACTVIGSAQGEVFVNPTGNEAMATGGSGDVLSGIIISLMGQGLSGFHAAQLGAFVHGLSADLLRHCHAASSITASQLIEGLSKAWLHLEACRSQR